MKSAREARRRGLKDDIFSKLSALVLVSVTQMMMTSGAGSNPGFVLNGFKGVDLKLNGAGRVESNGLLQLTNFTRNEVGHCFYPTPFALLNASSGEALSFSTSFVFAIFPQYDDISSHGIAFAIVASTNLSSALPSQHLGLFNLTNNGNPSARIVAVELDTIQNKEFLDINDNHVGIDVNDLKSVSSAPASFFLDSSGLQYQNLSLISGEPMRVWADYDGRTGFLSVTLAPLLVPKPDLPLLSSKIDLSSVILPKMYVGFSAATGTAAGSHYVQGWTFRVGSAADELNLSDLPPLPPRGADEPTSEKKNEFWIILLPVGIFLLLLIASSGVLLLVKFRRKFAEVVEEWETEYGPHRFSFKELYKSTRGFSDDNILGNGGFGGVYKGRLSKSKLDIAVKRISHDSKQGMKEFVAEIASIGRLRHRNLVQLLGYCRRHGELLLIYDYMPNGSLDRYIFDRPEETLGWEQRFKIIRGIAAGLLYLHEEWEQVVLHRDIKASNVLLDADFNGKLGDFGLARLHDRGGDLHTTRVVGTFGYLAPELSRTGKSTTSSDVFGFGAFLLEVACGKRPIELKTSGIDMVLVDWVMGCLKKGQILEARDRKLRDGFVAEELEMVLRLGLMCSHPSPSERPTMRQVVQYLEGEAALPAITEFDFYVFDSGSRRKNNRFMIMDDISSDSATAELTNLASSSSQE